MNTMPSHDDVALKRIANLIVALYLIMAEISRYTLICRLRNYHEPDEDSVNELLAKGGGTVESICTTCACELELRNDPDDDDAFWIAEV